METLQQLQLVLWVLGPLGQAITAVMILRRNLVREIPWFFAYTLFHILNFLVLFVAYHVSYEVYFYGYWVAEGIDAILVILSFLRRWRAASVGLMLSVVSGRSCSDGQLLRYLQFPYWWRLVQAEPSRIGLSLAF